MVWKKVRKLNEEDEKHISKLAIKKKNQPLYFSAKTRTSKDLKQAANCKITVKKKATNAVTYL